MRVLLAPDKFKGSATARQVGEALAAGIRAEAPATEVLVRPIADGGEGSLDLLADHGFTRVTTRARDPHGVWHDTPFALRGDHAVVESAAAYGLARLGGRPTRSSGLLAGSHGVGDLIRAARDHGARRITVTLGGSCGTDGGAGALEALGAVLLDRHRRRLPSGGAALAHVDRIDLARVAALLDGVTLEAACDVDNPLLGPHGTAPVYAPQKGAGPAEVAVLEHALAHWAHVVARITEPGTALIPGAGAAGGLGFGLAAVGATIVSGVETLLRLTGFEADLIGSDLVVVGEGRLDAQSLHGKGPIGVARLAERHGVPVVAVAGRCTLEEDAVRAAGIAQVFTLAAREPDPARSRADVLPLLEGIGRDLAAAYAKPGVRTR